MKLIISTIKDKNIKNNPNKPKDFIGKKIKNIFIIKNINFAGS